MTETSRQAAAGLAVNFSLQPGAEAAVGRALDSAVAKERERCCKMVEVLRGELQRSVSGWEFAPQLEALRIRMRSGGGATP